MSEQRNVRASPLSSAALTPAAGLRVNGAATIYRIYDVGYGINLDTVVSLLAANMPERVRPERGEGQAIHIANPPITVVLGGERLAIAGHPYAVEISARIFDFGVVSMRIRIPTPAELSWDEFTQFGNRVDAAAETNRLFATQLDLLMQRVGPAVDRMKVATVTEDYAVYRISRLRDASGEAIPAEALCDIDVVPLLLNEQRPLSGDARRELLPHRFSYYADDLAILTWDNALVVDPSPDDETEVQYVLEFANAQLLELRYYDALLDAELPKMYERVASARTGIRAFRNRKLSIIRDTYGMLNDEAQAARSEVLEIAIVVLILAEILLALTQRF